MSIISLDRRGRLTLPREFRDRLKVRRYLVYIKKDELRMVPLPEPEAFRGFLKISESMEEIEEKAEKSVDERACHRLLREET